VTPTLESITACPPFPSLTVTTPAPPVEVDLSASHVKQAKIMIVDDESMNIKIATLPRPCR
jgi:hypothetical protein